MSVQVQGPQRRPVADDPAAVSAPPGDGASVTAPSAPPADGMGRPAAPTTSAPPEALPEVPARGRRRSLFSRRVLLPVLAVIIIVAAFVGFNFWQDSQMYVSTDNAQLSGQPIQVGSVNAGRVDTIVPNIGDQVHRGDVVASVALPSQVGVGQNGQPKMGFLGAGDTHVDIQAPVDGVVIAVPVAVGATVSAGQEIIAIVDPSQLWVNANIDETDFNRIKVGQPVTVHVDALGADVQGKVEAVTPATQNTFSMLPTNNTSGNFTKVTQLVPVRIAVHLGDQPMLLGANVEVKIRTAD
ncbi:MAG: efflux RND transporter periplasmic adaptor subunit [Chloroflexi bacterium]|nr:efflux RND transporter periplasmic adaptor subunit [Chloroflexota bacterium]